MVSLLAPGAAFAQTYSISTLAGGVPIPTPVPGLGCDSAVPGGRGLLQQRLFQRVPWSGYPAFFKLGTDDVLTRIAGNARSGLSGDGGPALDAQFHGAGAVAVDNAGNVCLADSDACRISKLTPDGIIAAFVDAEAVCGNSGDGGPAVGSQIAFNGGLAVDAHGNLYIADSGNHLVRVVSSDGIIRTAAGNGLAGNTGDGGPALQASIGTNMYSMNGLTVDAAGDIFLAVDNAVREVSADGVITTVPGSEAPGTPGNNTDITGVAVDRAGNLYVAENRDVVGISPDGTAAVLVDGEKTTPLLGPTSVALDANGNVLVADMPNNRLLQVTPNGAVNTLAGNGLPVYLGDGGPARDTQLNLPSFVAADQSGDVLISDFADHLVRKVSPGGTIRTIAGVTGPLVIGARVVDGQTAVTAQIGRPAGVVSDQHGAVFVADSDNACVWKITADGLIHRFVGNDPSGQPVLRIPWGIALDTAGNLYVADESANRVYKVLPSGAASVFAGNGEGAWSGDGGPAVNASLFSPGQVAVDGLGNVDIADRGNFRVRKVSTDGIITTIMGDGTVQWDLENVPAADAHTFPASLAVDSEGTLYVLESWEVRRIGSDGMAVRIAGSLNNYDYAYTGDCGPATQAQFYGTGLAVDGYGDVYIADAVNAAVRMVTPRKPRRRSSGRQENASPSADGCYAHENPR